MPAKVFIDSNIYIYAKVENQDTVKHKKANEFLLSLEDEIIISIQIINEFYNVLNRHKVADEIIQAAIESLLKEVIIGTISMETIRLCWRIKTKYKYGYYDSLVIASALESNCTTLYSEDLQHGQFIENTLKIINPLIID